MIERNIRMTEELRDALNFAAENCHRSQSEAVRCCLKYASRQTAAGFSVVGLCEKSKYPTESGPVFITIEIQERYADVSAELIRCAIALKLSSLPAIKPVPDFKEFIGIPYTVKS
jgi:hypothetical protein